MPDRSGSGSGRSCGSIPGKQAHLSVAWRLAPGAEPPDRIDYGVGSLPIPGS